MRGACVLIALLLVAAAARAATPCFLQQSTSIDATVCLSTPTTPFCYFMDDGNTYCTPCNPNRATDWQCDCAPGYYCRPALPTIAQQAGTCVPFDRSLRACLSPSDCDVWSYFDGVNNNIMDYRRFSCINGYCRPCNQSYAGTGNYSCASWNHAAQNGSSRPGEVRWCDANGYWQGTVLPSNTVPSPTTAGTTSAVTAGGTTTTTSSTTTSASAMMSIGAPLALLVTVLLSIH